MVNDFRRTFWRERLCILDDFRHTWAWLYEVQVSGQGFLHVCSYFLFDVTETRLSMRVLLSVCFAAVACASKISSLKESITSKSTTDSKMMAQLGNMGPFKVINKDIIAKVSKEGKKVNLPFARQRGAWNVVEDNALIEAWSISERGIVVKEKDQSKTVQCNSHKGIDNKLSVGISFTCMLEGTASLHKPGWPIKTGYDALSDQENMAAEPFDDKDHTADWDPRVRFWHRCAGGENNGLSLCNRYRFIAADAQGYYGCDYMTQDTYCVQSYRHEWVEYNPNDLPFVFNPESPCEHKPCLTK